MPPEWSAALSRRTFSIPDAQFNPVEVVDNFAYGYFRSAAQQGVARLDLSSGLLETISVMSPSASGLTSLDISPPWLVWAQGDNQNNFGEWSIRAWNTQTKEKLDLGNSKLPDGSYFTGQLVFPVVGHGYVAWAQPVSQSPPTGELRAYWFGTHQTTVVDRGRLSSPVLWDRYLVWGRYTDNAGQGRSFELADAVTLAKVRVPSPLAQSQPITYLAGSPKYLAWSRNNSELMVMQSGTGGLTRYRYTQDTDHPLQFLSLAGHFLVWNGGLANAVVDLDTGDGIDLAIPSNAAGGPDAIVISTSQAPAIKGGVAGGTASVIQLSPDVGIRSCIH